VSSSNVILALLQLLYDWDCPDLDSPIKRTSQAKANASPDGLIIVLTRLPQSPASVAAFLGLNACSKWREIHLNLFGGDKMSKNVQNLLRPTGRGLTVAPVGLCLVNADVDDGSHGRAPWSEFERAVKAAPATMTSVGELLSGGAASRITSDWFVPDNSAAKVAEKKEDTLEALRDTALRSMQRHYRDRARGTSHAFSGSVPGAERRSGVKRKASLHTVPNGPAPKDKIPRRFSDESLRSHSSLSTLGHGVSRASRLVRMSSTTLETRRVEAEAARRAAAEEMEGATKAEMARMVATRTDLISRLEEVIDVHLHETSTVDEAVCLLGHLQADALKGAEEDTHLAGAAEVTVRTLLRRLEKTGESKMRVESLMEENFLVEPDVIEGRRTTTAQKVRDLKLQILYRAEVHWLLATRQKQRQYEAEILNHLRKLLTSKGSQALQTFLRDVMMPAYVQTQPDLLCSLYDELSLSKPKELALFFSPAKSVYR